jgi:signal transduction histidine kinase
MDLLSAFFLLLSLYHLVLFIKVTDRLYLYYIVLIFTSGLLVIPHSGFIIIRSNLYYDIVFVAFQISCILIGVNYLNFYERNKRIIQLSIILVIAINAYGVILPSIFEKYLTHAICLLIYLSILYLTIRQIKSKFKPSFWFLFPWVILFLAHVYYLINQDFILHYRQPIEVGLLANICFMALAIGNKLNIYKDQRRIAESKELRAIAERDRIINEQNKVLEQLIKERNKKILEKNLILSEKKKEIEEKNEIINETNQSFRQINQELLNKNNEILSQNQELQKHHELLEIIVNKRTKKLLAAKERAIVADKLKTSFLNNLTQEINTPMNSITGFANLLNDKNLTKEKRNEYLININKNVEILLESIDNVVILARIQARILKPKSKLFKVKDLIDRCLEVFNDKLKALGKNELMLQIESYYNEKDDLVHSDYEKIWQILYKLLDNSVKFTEKGYVKIKYGLRKSNGHVQNYNLMLKVEDSGVGIHEKKLDYILGRFSNIDEDKTILYHETGLGLAIVKGLVDILNGNIKVQSKPGTGTSFYVEIPVTIKSPMVSN